HSGTETEKWRGSFIENHFKTTVLRPKESVASIANYEMLNSNAHHRLERRHLHEHAGPFDLDGFPALEVAEQARHGFARRADHLRDFLVSEKDFQSSSLRRVVPVSLTPVEE